MTPCLAVVLPVVVFFRPGLRYGPPATSASRSEAGGASGVTGTNERATSSGPLQQQGGCSSKGGPGDARCGGYGRRTTGGRGALSPHRLTRPSRASTAAHSGLRPRRPRQNAVCCSPPRRWASRRAAGMQSAVARAGSTRTPCSSTTAASGQAAPRPRRLSAVAPAAQGGQGRGGRTRSPAAATQLRGQQAPELPGPMLAGRCSAHVRRARVVVRGAHGGRGGLSECPWQPSPPPSSPHFPPSPPSCLPLLYLPTSHRLLPRSPPRSSVISPQVHRYPSARLPPVGVRAWP